MSPAALVGALSGRGTATIDNLQISGFDPAAIEAASRAAQRGVAIDAVRIGDVVRSGLDAGRLNIPAASAVVTIEAGRATLSPLTVPAAGADVGISASYDLGADALDLRFGLIGPLKADAPGGQRPEISIALKGPVDAPRRTVEVASLVNWLTMRAVEQEAKRLEAAEQEAKRIQAQEEARRLAEEARRAAEDGRRLAEEEARRGGETRRGSRRRSTPGSGSEARRRSRRDSAPGPRSGPAAIYGDDTLVRCWRAGLRQASGPAGADRDPPASGPNAGETGRGEAASYAAPAAAHSARDDNGARGSATGDNAA